MADGTEFQSTPSPRRETCQESLRYGKRVISIHSLPKEGDEIYGVVETDDADFNPLPPQGGRQILTGAAAPAPNFNPLPPQGGRRIIDIYCNKALAISIHSLPKEGDC